MKDLSTRVDGKSVQHKRMGIPSIALALLCSSGSVVAAPLPPLAPVGVCGRVQSARWLPPRTLPPVPGMSGSAGRQRSWPGRFVVVLDGVRGATNRQKAQINALLTTSSDGAGVSLLPGQLLLVLARDDPASFNRADRLCVTGFAVKGDEGGTWTRYGDLRIISARRHRAGPR
ncbi:MAG: hypothetical protein ACM3YM_04960 [Sphingomonadales bacterium]